MEVYTTGNMHPEQRRILQEMTSERKLEIAVMLYRRHVN